MWSIIVQQSFCSILVSKPEDTCDSRGDVISATSVISDWYGCIKKGERKDFPQK